MAVTKLPVKIIAVHLEGEHKQKNLNGSQEQNSSASILHQVLLSPLGGNVANSLSQKRKKSHKTISARRKLLNKGKQECPSSWHILRSFSLFSQLKFIALQQKPVQSQF